MCLYASASEWLLTLVPQPFRLWLGVTEYLFCKPQLLDEAITTAIEDNTFRSDDLEFTFAARVCLSTLPVDQIRIIGSLLILYIRDGRIACHLEILPRIRIASSEFKNISPVILQRPRVSVTT